jgi:thiamine biosynthesis protein ThiI
MNKTNTFLIHYGELGLKGQNRGDFEKALKDDLMLKLSNLDFQNLKSQTSAQKNLDGKTTCKTYPKPQFIPHNKYFILKVTPEIDTRQIITRIKRVFGIKWFAQVKEFSRDTSLAQVTDEIIELAIPKADPNRTFKIDCKRADKRFPKNSQEIETKIGTQVIEKTKYQNVDLTNPDDTYYLEITHSQILIFQHKISGPGGLPVGASGRVLVLLSGGIDSPVAAYLAAKRGCSVDFLHFYVNEPGENDKIPTLARQVARFTGNGKLYLAPYLPFNMEVLGIDTVYELVLFRRFMFKVAEKLIQKQNLKGLITGDNLGQVASQTIENLTAADDALENITCLRPLVGYDKFEIIEIAKEIETFKISNQPHKDCCSIVDRHAKTRVDLETIRREEEKLQDYEGLIKDTLEKISRFSINL